MGNPWVYFDPSTPYPYGVQVQYYRSYMWCTTGSGRSCAVFYRIILNLYNYVYYYTKKTFHPLTFEAREGGPSTTVVVAQKRESPLLTFAAREGVIIIIIA